MNCQDALDLLHEIIDKEATDIDAKKVKEHLNKCRHCFEIYELEESIQDFINEKIEVSKSSENNTPRLDSLKSKIMVHLDEIDSECQMPKKKIGLFNMSTKGLVAAATLVLFVAAAFLSADFIRHQNYYIPIEKAHWSVSENISLFQDENKTNLIKETLKTEHSLALVSPVNGFSLIGGHNEEIMGVMMNHLIYQNNGDMVSVFIVPSNNFEIPGDLKDAAFVRENLTFFDHNCRGCRLVYHTTGDLIFITATTNREIDLLQFVPEQDVISSLEI